MFESRGIIWSLFLIKSDTSSCTRLMSSPRSQTFNSGYVSLCSTSERDSVAVKCFNSLVKDQTIAMSSVCDQLFPVGTIMSCAFHKTSMHWLPSNLGSWHSRSLFWVWRGNNFTVSLQQSVFWLGLCVPELPFLRLLLIVRESGMEKHSHKAMGSLVSTLG